MTTAIRKKRHINTTLKKALWILLCAVAVGALAYLAYFLLHYQLYDGYKAFIGGQYETEQSAPFKALAEKSADVPGMKLAAQNDTLKLYINEKTAEVAVYDKRTGAVLRTNPESADADPIANKTNKNYLRSQFILDYYNAARTAGVFDSYSMSVALGQVTAEGLADGVRFVYEVGEQKKIVYFVPGYLTKEWLDKIAEANSLSDAASVRRYYNLKVEGQEDVLALPSTARANLRTLRTLDGILKKGGFTEADYHVMNALGGEEEVTPLSFRIALEYRLKNDAVEVSLPVNQIEERGGGKLYRVQLLRMMGAAGAEERGYLVVPNGSGSLIRFNNGKTNTAAYTQYIYGIDLMDADYTKTQNTQTARLPIYGICRESTSVLASIERGASQCYLTADIAGKSNSYNYIYPSFILRGYDMLSMFGVTGSEADMPILETNMYDENITMRYTLLDEQNKGYAGLANYYRTRLLSEGTLARNTQSGDIPFVYDVIGGVKQTAHFIGVKYYRVYPMTTFAQAETIAKALDEAGVKKQVVNYMGWFNGGYFHDVTDRVDVLGNLGGQRGLEALQGALEGMGGDVYADVAFQNVTYISKRYNSSLESSRYYGSGYAAVLGQVNPGTLRRVSSLEYDENLYSLLSPKFLPRYVSAFASRMKNIDVGGISLRDLGDQVHSDKRRTNVIWREQALDIVRGQLDVLADTGKKLMVGGGNLYALKNASVIVGAPVTASEYFITDGEIPLYEMIVHGCADYVGLQYNGRDSADKQLDLLKMIEYGASCRFVFTHQEATNMKYTGVNIYYATNFAHWKDEAAGLYASLNAALAPAQGALMTAHETMENGVVRVGYDNGYTLYINYSDAPVSVDGLTVGARDYQAKGVDAL